VRGSTISAKLTQAAHGPFVTAEGQLVAFDPSRFTAAQRRSASRSGFFCL
jgi:hypothetical protein